MESLEAELVVARRAAATHARTSAGVGPSLDGSSGKASLDGGSAGVMFRALPVGVERRGRERRRGRARGSRGRRTRSRDGPPIASAPTSREGSRLCPRARSRGTGTRARTPALSSAVMTSAPRREANAAGRTCGRAEAQGRERERGVARERAAGRAPSLGTQARRGPGGRSKPRPRRVRRRTSQRGEEAPPWRTTRARVRRQHERERIAIPFQEHTRRARPVTPCRPARRVGRCGT